MAGLRIRWPGRSVTAADAAVAQRASAARLAALVWPAVVLIVVLAFAARVYNVNWDDGTHLHPDERFLTIVASQVQLPDGPAEYFDSARSPLNPYNYASTGSFVYGTLPLFLTKVSAVLLGRDNYDDIVLVGRWLSALFSAGTVLLAFIIGRRLYGSLAGLFAAALLTAAPLAIQHAHFFVVDPFLTFFMTATLYFALRVAEHGRLADYLLAGLMLGLAAACKVTGLLVVPVLLLAFLVRAWPMLTASWQRPPRPLVRQGVGLLLMALVALLAFRAAQPYAFDAPRLANLVAPWTIELNDRWLADQHQQNRLLSGEVGFPPSVQWIDRTSYLAPLDDMLRWGMSPLFGVAGWLGAAYAAYRLFRTREARHLLPLAFVLAYFGFMGQGFSLYMRYFLPLYPVLAVLAGYLLVELLTAGARLARQRGREAYRLVANGAVALVLAGTLLAGLAYLSIYSRPVTRVEATRWLQANLPPGASIAGEQWDEVLPLALPGVAERRFQVFDLALYEPDTQAKVERLIAGLDRADYVILSSTRIVSSIPRDPVTFPVTSRYYEALQSGELGFEPLRSFESYPSLLGIAVDDHGAQESWTSYDHPRVLVFGKTPAYSHERAQTLLGRVPFAEVALTPRQADKHGLMLTPSELETQRGGGTWTSLFSQDGFVTDHPTLVWLLTLQLTSLAALPVVLLLCRRLGDRGYLLSKPLGLLLLGYGVWLIVSLKLVHFTQLSIAGTLLALLALSALLAWRNRLELATFLRRNWTLVLVSEVVFVAAFLLFVELRMLNPDLWHPFRGGEKPMDLAYLTALTRSTTLPPYDPWLEGGYINYYYFGQFLSATLLKLTAIPPEVGYNLAVPTFFALTVAAAFSCAYNLAFAARRLLPRGRRPRLPSWSLYACGLLGAFFVAGAGNLDAVAQLADRLAAVSHVRGETGVPLLDPLISSLGGAWQVLARGAELRPFDYWRSSRMLAPSISITEFPYFSFLFADLHAHMMALAFEVVALGLCLNVCLASRKDDAGARDWGVIALLALVVGGLRWINSWDYPPFLLLALASIAISERRLEGGFPVAAGRAGLRMVVLVALSLLLYLPFSDDYLSPVAGLRASPETTPVRQYLAHFGVFLAPIVLLLAFLLVRALRSSALVRRPETRAEERAWTAVALGATVLSVACGALVLLAQPLLATLLPLLTLVVLLALREVRRSRPDAGLRLFLLALVALGIGLSGGVDLVTLDGDIVRMNTVFKFYEHVWVVFALTGAFAAWYLVVLSWRSVSSRRRGRNARRFLAASASLAGLLLVLAAATYPLGSTPARLDDRFAGLPPTLDGMAYMQGTVYHDARGDIDLTYDLEGMRWLRDNVEGTPAIVEGRTDLYRWGGRFSIYTGLPTVLGWDWHQRQQRGSLGAIVDLRARAVDDFYSGLDQRAALRFLRQYGVAYVLVGRLEQLYYPGAGLEKFRDGLGGALEVAYSNPQLTIYRVLPSVSSLALASP